MERITFVLLFLAICSVTSGQLAWYITVTRSDGTSSGISRDFDVCVPKFTTQYGVQSSEPGTPIHPPTVAWCIINCQDDALCVGFDYDPTGPSCNTYHAANFNTGGKSDPTAAQYTKIVDCDSVCHPSWSTNVGVAASSGGLPITDILASNTSALVGCLEYCARRTPTCFGIEYTPNSDPNGLVCKYFPTIMGTAKPAAQTTQYVMTNPCAETCEVTWQPYPGKTFDRLTAGEQTRNSTSTTVAQCDAACKFDPSCVIYMYPSDQAAPFYCTLSNGYGNPVPNSDVNSVIFEET